MQMDEKLNIMCTMDNISWYNGPSVRPTLNRWDWHQVHEIMSSKDHDWSNFDDEGFFHSFCYFGLLSNYLTT